MMTPVLKPRGNGLAVDEARVRRQSWGRSRARGTTGIYGLAGLEQEQRSLDLGTGLMGCAARDDVGVALLEDYFAAVHLDAQTAR